MSDYPSFGRVLLIAPPFFAFRDRLAEHFEVDILADQADRESWIRAHGDEVVAIGTDSHHALPDNLLHRLPNLRLVSCFGVGYDGIDVHSARKTGIIVTHTPDVLNDEVAHTTIMLLLAVTRRLLDCDHYVRTNMWPQKGDYPLTRSLAGKQTGLVGFGRIGQRTGAILEAMGCRIGYHSRHPVAGKTVPYYPDLLDLARESDHLVILVPGTAATRGMIDAPVLEALGPEGILINVARGPVVDEAALIAALEAKRIAGAGLDVFFHEPQVPEALRLSDRVVLTPHIGSATVETRQAMGRLATDNLIEFFTSGAALTPVPECR